MNTFTDIIIITKDPLELSPFNNVPILVINDKIRLISDCEIEYHNDILSFAYLIFDDHLLISNLLLTNILHEEGLPITNYFHQTNVENIFYCQKKDICNVIDDIINNIV